MNHYQNAYVNYTDEYFKLLPKPQVLYPESSNGAEKGPSYILCPCPTWLDDAPIIAVSGRSSIIWQIMDQGFFTVYLYIHRKKTLGSKRPSQEVWACDQLQRFCPKAVASIEGFYRTGHLRAQELIAQDINVLAIDLTNSFKADWSQIQGARLDGLEGAIEAHKRMLTILSNWAASEHVWVDVKLTANVAAQGLRDRAKWYRAAYETVQVATKHLKDLQLRAS
ncbi:unnamed protein product [Peniophora sp. CBMAI 1063]|nr:unnamed protein product [Peniophora sp. CBMAI 1063]